MADKKGRGRPKIADDQRTKKRDVGMTDEEWRYCLAKTEGASAFVRGLVLREMRR